MLRNQWINLLVWYAVGFTSSIAATSAFLVEVSRRFPFDWRDEGLRLEQALAYALVLVIVVGSSDYFHSRYVLRRDDYADPRQSQFSFDALYVDEGEYWAHLANAWVSLMLKCTLAFGGVWILSYLYPFVSD